MTFDPLAPLYRWMEIASAGRLLERCRTAWLASVPTPSRILLLGEGHGRSLAACRRQFPAAHLTCIEASAAMIAEARKHLARQQIRTANVDFIHTDMFAWHPVPQGSFDLIITHFFLDCFTAEEMKRLIPLIANAATPTASWLIADFQIAPAGWRRWRSRVIVALLYAFFRRTTGLSATGLVLPNRLLISSGFHLRQEVQFSAQLLKSEWWQRL